MLRSDRDSHVRLPEHQRTSRSDSVMNHAQASGRKPSAPSKNDAAPGLSAFVTEASITDAFSASAPPDPVLWEFPEESATVTERGGTPAIRKSASAPARYVAFAAAVVVAIAAGVWWRGAAPTAQPAASASVAARAVDTPRERQLDTISSVELGPFVGTPVRRVVANAPRIAADLPQAVPDDRQPTGRAASLPRGTSGGGAAAPSVTLAPAPRPSTAPSAPVSPVTPMAQTASLAPPATTSAVTLRPVDPPPALETAATPPPAPRPAPPVVRPEPQALPSVVATRSEQSEIQRTLGQYRSAYDRLDAEAAQAVWPSVDVRALARAFDSLSSQELEFETCLFDITADVATAQCRGSATYTPKVGGRGPKLEPRQWTFHLRKRDEGWKIESAQAKR
jgi:hypothetical protein